ncbi:MAG: ribbon-helix-helix domain-containing protein [Roseinatronobacter sp.]
MLPILATCHIEAFTMNDRKPMQLRLPPDLKAWIEAEAAKNGASQNSEVIRAIRDRMERTDHPTTP